MTSAVQHALELERQHVDLTRKLSNLPVSPTQALLLLRIEGEVPLSKVSGAPNFSYQMKVLIDGNFVKRRTDAYDRRSAHLSLTDKGRAVRDAAVRALQDESLVAPVSLPFNPDSDGLNGSEP